MRLPVIAEHVLHPAELLADVERPVLHPPYVHHVSHQQVAVDQPHLQDLGQLNGDDKGTSRAQGTRSQGVQDGLRRGGNERGQGP